MASNSVVQQQQQQQQQQQHQQQQQQSSFQQQEQQSNRPHHCKECGLFLNSAESLEVHLQYHKENLLNKWATQAASAQAEETNNNSTKGASIKREFIQGGVTTAAADTSDNTMMKKSPEYGNRATPEAPINFGHPPTPQSYHSASSPYQTPSDNSAFSPGFANYQPVKQERASPSSHYQQQQQQQQQQQANYQPFQDSPFFSLDSPSSQANQNYHQDFMVHKMNVQNSNFRYQPYPVPYERSNGGQSQVSSSSPASFPAQPTPSPSPKQCDKCGFVCDSHAQLIDHLNVAHPPTPAPHLNAYQQQQNQFMFPPQQEMKVEEDAQSEILDLDSHKVHQVYQEEDKRQNGDLNGHHSHTVSALLSPWSQQQQHHHHQQKLYQFMQVPDQKMYQNGLAEGKMYHHQEQKMYGSQAEYGMPSHEAPMLQQLPYRPFEHLPQSAAASPVISSGPQVAAAAAPAAPQPPVKNTNWKSNEARRPKTYNCTACNKWFTSSGHLKRHYNTTLHKNAVKSSGQPDPATLPISAHHHPARESTSREDRTSSSPGEESRGEDSLPPPPPGFDRGMLQQHQPPNGGSPYDGRQPPPNMGVHHLHHHHPGLHSPMAPPHHNMSSPPNGEAGLSAATMDSRGLLSSITSTASNSSTSSNSQGPPLPPPPHGFNMAPMMPPMDNGQFQMYPNGSAPHVTQPDMAISSPSITGEELIAHHFEAIHQEQQEQLMESLNQQHQPLPSFAQIQSLKGMNFLVTAYRDDANVGGLGPVTAPYSYYTNNVILTNPIVNTDGQIEIEEQQMYLKPDEEGEYHITMMTAAPANIAYVAEPMHNNNNLLPITKLEEEYILRPGIENAMMMPASPEKARTKRDYEPALNSPSQVSSQAKLQLQQNQPDVVHKCIDCDKTFNKSCYLTQHNKTFHSGDKPFKCTRCGKRFSYENQYKEHLAKHNGEKPHKCELCPKQFNHKTDLRRHMCLHTGQKPYACETCGKGFIRKDHMLKHCETHLRKPQSKLLASMR